MRESLVGKEPWKLIRPALCTCEGQKQSSRGDGGQKSLALAISDSEYVAH